MLTPYHSDLQMQTELLPSYQVEAERGGGGGDSGCQYKLMNTGKKWELRERYVGESCH